MINFLQSKLFNHWTHFERLILGYYSRFSVNFEPGFVLTIDDVVSFLAGLPQSQSAPNLRRYFKLLQLSCLYPRGFRLFTSLAEAPPSKIANYDQFYIVFVASITQDAADIIRPIIQNQLNGAKVTFVALKNVDQNILHSLVPDVIDWSDLSKTEPNNWEQQFWSAYGCRKISTMSRF